MIWYDILLSNKLLTPFLLIIIVDTLLLVFPMKAFKKDITVRNIQWNVWYVLFSSLCFADSLLTAHLIYLTYLPPLSGFRWMPSFVYIMWVQVFFSISIMICATTSWFEVSYYLLNWSHVTSFTVMDTLARGSDYEKHHSSGTIILPLISLLIVGDHKYWDTPSLPFRSLPHSST